MKREPAVSGIFYPSNKEMLIEAVSSFLKDARKKNVKGKIKAIIVPHAGYIYSGIVAGACYKLVRSFDKVVILGPSHNVNIEEPFSDSSESWETPLGSVAVERFFSIKNSSEVHTKEHSIEVQLPFLQRVLGRFTFFPIALNYFDDKLVGRLKNIEKNTLIVVSSDLSHYLPYDEAVKTDRKTIDYILKLDFDSFVDKGDACGNAGISVLLKLAKERKWKPVLIDYRNSGDTSGNKEGVVGYAGIVFTE